MLGRVLPRRLAAAAAVGVVVAGVLIAGLVAGGALAYAQATATPTPPGGKANGRAIQPRAVVEQFLENLARNLGVDRQRLQDAATQARNQTLDQLVKDGKLTAAQAERLKQRPVRLGSELGLLGRLRRGPAWGHHGGPWQQPPILNRIFGNAALEAVAAKIGLTPEQLRDQMRAGKTISELAREKNVTQEQLRQAVVDALKARADQAEKDGRLTKEQADRLRQRLQEGGGLPFGLGLPFGGMMRGGMMQLSGPRA